MYIKQFIRGARGRGRGRGVGGHRQGWRGNRRSPGMVPDMSELSLTDVCATYLLQAALANTVQAKRLRMAQYELRTQHQGFVAA